MTRHEVTLSFPGIVHYVAGREAYASSGSRIFKTDSGGKRWEMLARLPLSHRSCLTGGSRVLRRFFRTGVYHAVPSGNRVLIVLGYGRIFRIHLDTKHVEDVAEIRGRRPLSLERWRGDLLYGEYRGNPKRTPVSVWRGKSGGRSWEAAWTFEGIRHIHGVFSDPYSDDVWITTGDEDSEAALWVTRDGFDSMERVLGGSQQTRVVRLIFDTDHIYFGSDTPRERNHIYRMDRRANRVERLVEVGGSIFHGARRGKWILFSTACEPSRVNSNSSVEVWGSLSGCGWRCVATFVKDAFPMKLFQYGQVLFPAGPGELGHLWLTPIATRGDQVSVKMPLKRWENR